MSWKRTIMAVLGLIIVLSPLFVMLGSQFKPSDNAEEKTPYVSVRYIDVQKVFENSARGKMQRSAFQEEFAERSAQLKTMEDELKSLQKEIQVLASNGNARAAQSRVPKFQALQKKYVEAQQKASQELSKVQADVDKTFMMEVRNVANQLRNEVHVDVVQAYDANKVLSYDASLDVTDQALAKYNQLYPANEATSASKAQPDKSPADSKKQ